MSQNLREMGPMSNSGGKPKKTHTGTAKPAAPRRSKTRRTVDGNGSSITDGLEALHGLPAFAAVVAHEIRNPLSAVKIALQTVERHGEVPVKDAMRLRIALREVATIERVLTSVLDWARPGELRVESVPPREVLDAALALAQSALEEKQIVIVRAETDALPLVRVDAMRVAHALSELVRNAVDASKAGATIHLSTTAQTESVAFIIEDAGSGLSEEDLARAFDPFFSRKARGIGLGLPRARAVAQRHHGDVVLEKRPAGGTRATLRLPVPGGRA